MQLLIPTVCDILLIAKISPFDTDRYVMNVMGIIYLLVFAPLILFSGRFTKKAVSGILALAFMTLFCSYQGGVPYLYSSERENVEVVEELGTDVPCLYIYDGSMHVMPNYQDMAGLDQIVFLRSDHLDKLREESYQNYDKLLVYIVNTIDAEADDVLQQLLENNPGLDTYKTLFSYGYSTAYYLE